MTHSECIRKLIDIGKCFGFHSVGRSYGKMYHLGNPDCVWYYKGRGAKELYKIAKGDKYKYLPIIAFEVPYSEKEKALRGTLVTLQLTNAAASVIVMIGKSEKYKSYMNKLIRRYSSTRFRIWTEKEIKDLYDRVLKQSKSNSKEKIDIHMLTELESILKNKYDIAVGIKSLHELTHSLAITTGRTVRVSGRSYKTGRQKLIKARVADLYSP